MLSIRQLSLYRGDLPLLAGFDLDIQPGEIVSLMGPSGCGKSTLLAWLCGTQDAEIQAHGQLVLDGLPLDSLPTEQRGIGILFQDDLLFAHLNVGQNLAFALPARVRGAARQAAIDDALASAGLAGFAHRDPATLSGGQRARVSLLRALLAEPRALLLDEPFSRLDAALRGQFRDFVFQRLRDMRIPALLVTHDTADCPPDGRVLHWPEATHA